MRRLLVIGMGAGDPEYLTVQAIKALNQVDVFFVLEKGEAKEDLVRLRTEICERYIEDAQYRIVEATDPVRDRDGPGYEAAVEAWHTERVSLYERLLAEELPDGGCGGILAWGDPTLYDSTLRIVDQIIERGSVDLEYEVVPGISAVAALAARHRLSLNRIGGSVHITTGRRLAAGWPGGADTVVVMLDGRCAFLAMEDTGVDIYWGAYLGTEDEILISGRLADCKHEIERARTEARARKGWMFDTYLLRRTAPEGDA